ncbi:triosephosphate isomerase [Candidatus Roizmanbacteria bacterium]|jgi:triosephosphate isomerase|nr:triosephosphate isomerase [Candidatus Roizmanbacteria bacterium]
MKYFIANWKANKNADDALAWSDDFLKLTEKSEKVKNLLERKLIKVIICPPLTLIYPLKERIKRITNICLGCQNFSLYEKGAYTGENPVQSLVGIAEYAIIGHSERRLKFGEDQETVNKKIDLAQKYGIEPIVCISCKKEWDSLKKPVKLVAFEPLEAIGSGNNMPVKKVIDFRQNLKINDGTEFIYGGSVNEKNIPQYALSDRINGFLVGGASLDPLSFFNIIKES